MLLYISDLHFGHKNAIGFDHRPFADVEEMDQTLIERWNKKVHKNDEVYFLGDLCFRNDKPAEWYLDQLKGRKHLVVGNHDMKLLKNETAMTYFETVNMMVSVRDHDKLNVLCHYPIADWNGGRHGSWHIYGHIHNSTDAVYQFMKTQEHALNAGCMINNYAPATFDELIENNKAFRRENCV
ncbi:MAG: hydrolase [Clostridia bacterium]|nr:hydrolase [Clostridia bacterium]NCC44582.1 hydrolase [Clostridia bacterium]